MRVSAGVNILSSRKDALFERLCRRTSSMVRFSAAIRSCTPSTAVCLARIHGPHSHSFSSTVTTSLSMGGL
jgi:hypothetical protein